MDKLPSYLRQIRIDELDIIELDAPFGYARVAMQGAHLMDWRPAGQAPVLWLSEAALFKPGKAIRGGVPICWPWFGPHPRGEHPAHGFARTSTWALEHAETSRDEAVLVWSLQDDAQIRTLWPHPFRLRYTQRFGQQLTLTLETEHLGSSPADYSFALHSYFNVGDVAEAAIEGLEGIHFADKLTGDTRIQQGQVVLTGAMDRVYLEAGQRYLMHRGQGLPALDIVSTGCPSAIVWNPWKEGAAKLADMAGEGWRSMLCLEHGAALQDTITLQPSAVHRASVTVGLR